MFYLAYLLHVYSIVKLDRTARDAGKREDTTMAKVANRKATDYLAVGDVVSVPTSISAPIIYSEKHPNGATVRVGRVCELLIGGGVCVDFGGKSWDYSNREALQFSRIH